MSLELVPRISAGILWQRVTGAIGSVPKLEVLGCGWRWASAVGACSMATSEMGTYDWHPGHVLHCGRALDFFEEEERGGRQPGRCNHKGEHQGRRLES
jgi:hypothetical protein